MIHMNSSVSAPLRSRLPHAANANGVDVESDPRCAICGRRVTRSFHVANYRFNVCSFCDYAFIDPAIAAALRCEAIFDDTYFVGGGPGYANYVDEGQLLRARGARYGRLLARVGARRVLDVGAAAGFVLRGLLDVGCTGVGIEPNRSMAAYGARELALDMRGTTLEEFETNDHFDVVTMLQVVDHLQDLQRSLAQVRGLTKPGGWCLVEFGNRASITARVLGTAWHEYAPPSVQRVFSLRALRLLMAAYGFELHSSGWPAKYLRADHALSLLRYKADAPIAQAVLDRLALAIPSGAKLRYLGDDITWALFAKKGQGKLGATA
jgi:SAM-dependent methyltransferase